MARCKKIKINRTQVCIGDMNRRITLHIRSITGLSDGVDFDETLSDSTVVWAALQTIKGEDIFDGTNVIGTATHNFFVRAISTLTAETWLEYNGEYYDVLDIQNYEERNLFMVLRCSVRGDTSKETNLK